VGFFISKNMTLLYSEFLKSSGVQTDTRKITENCLFFCLKGANFDGNTFAEEAIAKGAYKAVIDDASYEITGKTILVDDVLTSLQQLAHEHRMSLTIPIIGITGSNGKTTSKELIGAVLATQFNTYFTKGNLNNHIGVPLSLLELTSEHEIAVIEMGANKPGDIHELVSIAHPTHGIITNIGRAHLEGFGSLEGVIQTKTELFRFLATDAKTIFVNKGDETIFNQIPTTCNVQFYGEGSELTGELVQLTPFVEMTWQENDYTSPLLTTQLVGEYNFTNFLAAIRIGRFFGVTQENCNKAITEYQPTNNRSQVSKTAKNTLIVDCYNANPTSMSVALSSFAKIDNHAKIFILGDMREMGQDAAMVHEEVVQQTIDLRLSGFFIGEEFLRFKGIHPQAIFLKSVEPLIEHFEHNPPADLLILLKGSRGISLEKVIPYL
jgi:UDP-N-acetylmuramoyl-tripeptide--D-alanyl-D-alanine ligase